MRIRGKTVTLRPNLRFGRETVDARCRNSLTQLLTLLYEGRVTADKLRDIHWRIDADRGLVRLFPRVADGDNEGELWTRPPTFEFAVDDYRSQLTACAEAKQPSKARAKLHRQLRDWIVAAASSAFESNGVQVEYSWFNHADDPFSITASLVADQCEEKPLVLWSNERKFKRLAPRRTVRPAGPTKRPNCAARGWQRYYYDDGQTRRFWYVHRRGTTQTTIQGDLGTVGRVATKTFASAQEARAKVQRAVDQKVAKGYIAYEPSAIRYCRKNRFAIKLIKQALVDFETQQQVKLDAQYRQHLLTVNGGTLEDGRCVSLPGHPREQEEVTEVLGLKPGQPAWDLDYCSASFRLPPGHTLVAESEDGYFLLTPSGAVVLPDGSALDDRDVDDDNKLHLIHLPMILVAHSFDEFLTRVARFPNDVSRPIASGTQDRKKKSDPQESGRRNRSSRVAEANALATDNSLLRPAYEVAASSKVRRFYFDDGELQKYWYIECSGKQFTTYYGRFGVRPADTRKEFGSAEEARRGAEKIIAQKLRKGYREVLRGALPLKRPRGTKAATASAIKSLEKQLGTSLPEDYRDFLATQNGGEPTPGFIRISGMPHIEAVDVQYLLGLYPKDSTRRSLQSGIEQSQRLFPEGHLLIAYGNDFFTLSLKYKPGCIWFLDHECDDVVEDRSGNGIDRFRPSAAHLLAHCFDEFTTRIATYGAT